MVREPPAPSGALRPRSGFLFAFSFVSQGAPSTTRCINSSPSAISRSATARGQGAPSTTRCIKTPVRQGGSGRRWQGQGAHSTIRCIKTVALSSPARTMGLLVREHPAPSGALRPPHHEVAHHPRLGGAREHPAPSGALRPETVRLRVRRCFEVREHPAPSGAFTTLLHRSRSWSSTQVPSRCCGGALCGRAVSAPPVSFSAR